MKKEQIIKILQVAIISTLIMLVAEAIFDIPAVTNWFSDIITSSKGIWIWIIIWIIMFLQVTILNIPAYVILSASTSIGIKTLSFAYIAVVLSAYMVGCLVAYWLGYKFGRKAVRWCAGSDEDYDKWSKFLNKKGKIWYFLTVIFPFFPDDLLCLVAGSVKFDFGFYTLANFVGRGIGLVTMLITLHFITNFGNGIPLMLIVWAVALIAELVFYFIIKSKNKKSEQQAENIEEQEKEKSENIEAEKDKETEPKNLTKETTVVAKAKEPQKKKNKKQK